MADPGLIRHGHHHGPHAAEVITTGRPCASTEHREEETSSAERATHGDNIIRNAFQNSGRSEEVIAILLKSWREGTQARYQTYLQRWQSFCDRREINLIQPPINCVLDCLREQYSLRIGYSALNSARSALSTIISIDNVTIGHYPLVSRFLRGVINERPALLKYTSTRDARVVLRYLKSLSPVSSISLKLITHKLIMLMLLFSRQSGQTVHRFDIRIWR